MKVIKKIVLIYGVIFIGLICHEISYGSTGKKALDGNYLRGVFKEFICNQTGLKRDDIIISKFRFYGNNVIPDGRLEYQVFRKNRGPLSGYVRLVMIVKVNGVPTRRLQMSGWVDVFRPVVCAMRSIKRGQRITNDDIYIDRRNISRISDKVITDMNEIIGMIAKHTISEDTIIKKWMVEKPPVVRRGDIVTVVARKGDLQVTVPGRVLESGFRGDVIRVQNTMSRKEIYAKIIDKETVMVEF